MQILSQIKRVLSSIFDAFVGEYHIVAVSVKRVEDPSQGFSTLLS